MYWGYLKSAFRYYQKKKLYYLFNIAGLLLTVCACSFILFWISNELSYDKSFPDYESIYRITTHIKDEVNGDFDLAMTSQPLGEALSSIPGTKNVCRLKGPVKDVSFLQNNSVITANNVFYSDSSFFKIFKINILYGVNDGLLSEPNSILISKNIYNTYFAACNPVGKYILLNISGKERLFKINGVFNNLPGNSHFHPDYLISFASVGMSACYSHWDNSILYTYVLLDKKINVSDYLKRLQNLLKQNINPEYADYWSYKMQKISDIHLSQITLSQIEAGGNKSVIYIIGAGGILLLLSTFANYVVVSLTSFIARLKDPCLRKILGAGKRVLFLGFLFENLIVLMFPLILSILLLESVFTVFNSYTGLHLKYSVTDMIFLSGVYITLSLIVSASLAFYYSRGETLTLNNKFIKNYETRVMFNKILIIAQFFIAGTLSVLSVLANNQLQYLKSFNTGIDAKKIIIVPLPHTETDVYLSMIKQEILKDSRIKNVSFTSANPVNINMVNTLMHENKGVIGVKNIAVDADFLPAMGLNIIRGKNFQGDNSASGIIINECAAKKLNALNMLNEEFELPINDKRLSNLNVIGVIKDFNFRSLYNPVEPLVIFLNAGMCKYMVVNLSGNSDNSIISTLRDKWHSSFPGTQFKYSFLDDEQRKLYGDQDKVSVLLGLFSLLTIFIAILGFSGLARFAAEKKAREISIRRILGSSVKKVTMLVSWEFVYLIIISALFAFPASYFLYSGWIRQFSFQIPFSIWPYIITLSISGIMALAIVSLSIVRVALVKPIKVLKCE
jgi:putative ABC transport system permease protein